MRLTGTASAAVSYSVFVMRSLLTHLSVLLSRAVWRFHIRHLNEAGLNQRQQMSSAIHILVRYANMIHDFLRRPWHRTEVDDILLLASQILLSQLFNTINLVTYLITYLLTYLVHHQIGG